MILREHKRIARIPLARCGPQGPLSPHTAAGNPAAAATSSRAPAASTAATARLSATTAASDCVITRACCRVLLLPLRLERGGGPFWYLTNSGAPICRGPFPRCLGASFNSWSSNSSSVSGLRELLEQQEENNDSVRHRRAPKKPLVGPSSPLGAPTTLRGAPSRDVLLEDSAAFAAAAAARQKLQQLQQPKAPRRRQRLLLSSAAAAATAGDTSAAATAAAGLRLLHPDAAVAAAFRAATNNARNENLWKGLCRRLALAAPHLSPHQLSVALHATARVK